MPSLMPIVAKILFSFMGLLLLAACESTDVNTPLEPNASPIADAGINQNVLTGSVVNLNGNGSRNTNNDELSYAWLMSIKPNGSGAALDNSTSITPSFTADMDGIYELTLVVKEGSLSSESDTVVITSATGNSAPVANAGNNQNVITGSIVTLDGSDSSDANNDAMTYVWTMTAIPSGSNASLNNSAIINPSFNADVDGSYVLSLLVNDGQVSSQSDNVTITSTTTIAANDFDDFAGTGALIGYTTNNPNSLPDVERVDGRYRANLVNNDNEITLHFNQLQGRLDAKLVNFPFEVIARNIGIGTQADSQIAPSPVSSNYIFAGIQVHVPDLDDRTSSHLVVGHRGNTIFTVEGKNTVSGSSAVDDDGRNVAPDGRVDLRIVGNANRTLTAYWQQPNLSGGADNWDLYKGDGDLREVGNGRGVPDYGASVYVGLITYAQGSANIPFVGTCDSFEIIQQ